ncbi:tetratricopeptide repeat protein [Chryseobacterium sp.]|uniref:tetratricopeptide repeat protein n=1 Tax=Chryseobacterium sp. TaxID=1871047 RepID=UPI002FC9AE31
MLNPNNKINNWFIDQLNLYQSANSDFKSIKRNFIIREAEFTIITEALLNKESNDSLQHELILGRRGSGKSTLLKRIEIEITENKKLNKKYIPINLAEEQAGIYRLFDLWEQVIEELQHQFKIIENKKEFEEFTTIQDYTRHLYDVIHNTCIKYKKKIVLLLDNFDRIVENFNDDGNLLREILINYNDVEIIAGSTRMDEHFWKYDMPFYEFFRKHRLEALSREEMLLLLNHWADSLNIPELKLFIKNNTGKLENVRILTDGLPRTLQFFIQIVLQNSQSHGYDYLKKIMDHVTPLYQERLNYLPAQLRKIILEMAFIWESCTTKQLVEKTRMESKLISANLKTLVLKGIVDKIETSKKNHLYRISERFFNMWLIFTQGNPEQKRKAKCLSIFLENWYDAQDFKILTNNHISLLISKKIDYENALILSKALSQSKYISLIQRDSILNLTEKINIRKEKSQLIHLPKKSSDILNEALKELENKNHKVALDLVNSLENEEDGIKFNFLGMISEDEEKNSEAEKYYLLAIKKGEKGALLNLANIYHSQKKYNEAEKYYLLAIEDEQITALCNLAILYYDQKKYKQAEKYYLLAIGKGENDVHYNLAILYYEQKKYAEAEKYYLLAIEKNNTDSDALFNLALLYQNQEKYDKAENYYLLAGENGDNEALNNLAVMYEKQEKYEKAERHYLLAIEINNDDSLFNLALLYQKQEKYKEAEKYYLLAIDKNNISALNNLAIIYEKQEKYKEAKEYFLLANKKNDNSALYNLALLYEKQENFKEAEKYYLLAIKNNNINALNNLATLFYNQNIKKRETLNLLIQNNENPQNLIIAEIWNGVLDNLENKVNSIIYKNEEDLENFIIDLLIHQQKNLVLKLFRNFNIGKTLQEKYTVLFYVCMLINNPNEENLELKIPPEIETTIKEILQLIKEKEKFYGYVK